MRTIRQINEEIEVNYKNIKTLKAELEQLKKEDLSSVIVDIENQIEELSSNNITVRNINVSSQLFGRMNSFFLEKFIPIAWSPIGRVGKYKGIPLYENYHIDEFEYYIGV